MTKYAKILIIFLAFSVSLPAREKRLENTSGLWDVRLLTRVGFIDYSGRLVINPQFEAVGFFSEDLCAARRGPLWGYIDRTGRLVIQAQFDEAGFFSEGLAVVAVKGRMGYIDQTGRRVMAAAFEEAGPFQEGRARVKLAGRWGYLDAKGNRIGPADYEEARDFFEGLAAVKMRGQWGYIDKTGKVVITPRFLAAEDFQEGRAVVGTPRGANFIDPQGRVLFAGRDFPEAQYFSEGLAAVRLAPSGRFGFINAQGATIILPRYEQALPFCGGLAAVSQRGKWGYIDRQGQTVIDFRFAQADCFINGLARVSLLGREGYVDQQGRMVWEPGQNPSGPAWPRKDVEASAAGVVIRYNMGGLTDILIQDAEVIYTYSKYMGQNPYAEGSIQDYKFFKEKAGVSAGELEKLLAVFKANGFEGMEAEYGKLEEGERYYGISLSLKTGGKEKTVLFKSNPQTEAPPAFTNIENALFAFVKEKFKK
jgi:WG containing repeat